ncbi:MAG: LytTR family DNA-binding domain-containing protein [Flavihumibacter sp.]|jgi:DNA-binding LytR/AlgR family response regulator|nr:LytTR family DNA-binding domain-containing protein [Flavihumibacter sp.]
MQQVVIIEDEKYAAVYLQELLEKLAPDMQVVAVLENVSDAIKKLPALNPDLILADIQLEDGISFQIFEALNWTKPVIFITAYDSYAIRAFKVNGIDYLLKPYDEEELSQALEKFRRMAHPEFIQNLKAMLQQVKLPAPGSSFKERFAITLGSRIVSVPVQDVAYFFYANRTTHLVQMDGQKYPYSESLDSLYNLLNPTQFFRANRNYIIHHRSIDKIENHAGRNIVVYLSPLPSEGSISISKDRITEFKYWLDA